MIQRKTNQNYNIVYTDKTYENKHITVTLDERRQNVLFCMYYRHS